MCLLESCTQKEFDMVRFRVCHHPPLPCLLHALCCTHHASAALPFFPLPLPRCFRLHASNPPTSPLLTTPNTRLPAPQVVSSITSQQPARLQLLLRGRSWWLSYSYSNRVAAIQQLHATQPEALAYLNDGCVAHTCLDV